MSKHVKAISIGAVTLSFIVAALLQPWAMQAVVIALKLGAAVALSWVTGWTLILLYRLIKGRA